MSRRAARSMPGFRFVRVLAAVVLAVLACSRAAPVVRRGFAPGEVAAEGGPLRAEVLWVEYADDRVRVMLRLHAEAANVHVDADGVLLASGDLEYPARDVAGRPALHIVRGRDVALELTFVLGHALTQPAGLSLRSVRSGARWLEPISLTVPAAEPGPAAHR